MFDKLRIRFVSITEAVDTATPFGRTVFQIIASISELERSLIRERVVNGLKNAKAKGKQIGAKQKYTNVEVFKELSDSNSYSEVNRLMREFRQITDTMNVAFILLHHSSKASPKSALGSQAFEGSVDNIISIFDSNGHYFYETNGRFNNIEKTEIVLDPENHHLSTDELSGLSDEEKVLKVISGNDGLSGSAAAKLIKKNKSATLELVKNLESQKKIVLVDGKYKVSG